MSDQPDHLTKEQQQELGSFYTPPELAIKMAKQLNIKKTKKNNTILDPTCGKGALLEAVKIVYSWVTNDMLYGVDIDKEAILYCIERFPGGHFQYGDILKDDITDDNFWKKEPLSDWQDVKKEIWSKHEYTFKVIDKLYKDLINDVFKETMTANIRRMINLNIESDFVFFDGITYSMYKVESNMFHIYRGQKHIINVS